MILTNKRTTYNVNHSNETAKLTGNISLNEDNIIENFNGSFMNLIEEDDMESSLGLATEANAETLNKSIYGVPFFPRRRKFSIFAKWYDN